jgi:RNA polymerase sigma factor FliA
MPSPMTSPAKLYRANGQELEERNELVLQELPQVYYVAARIRERLPKHVEMEDLVQAGVIGLLEACRNYDSDKDAQFSTFAKHRIRGAILDSLRKLDWGSRALRRRGREIAACVAALEGRLGRYPQEEEIAAELKMRVDELQSTLAQLDGLLLVGQTAQVTTPGSHAESFDLIESAPADDEENPLEMALRGEMKEELAAAVATLSEREQLILSLYYYEELTMKEVAEVVGIAVSRVSQIHAATMLKLRVSLTHLRSAENSRKGVQTIPRARWKVQS